MIVDDIKNFRRYTNINKNIEVALNYVYNLSKKDAFEEGIFEINKSVKAVHIRAEKKRKVEMDYEIHKNHMDIHVVYSGEERLGYLVGNENKIYAYDAANDIAFINSQETKSETMIRLKKNMLCLIWPYECHKPLVLSEDETEGIVEKIILKVKL